MRNVAKLRLRITLLAALLAVFSFAHIPAVYAQATDNSEIRAEICYASGPQVLVSSPQSDSVTNDRVVVLAGTTQRTSQIDILLNTQYSQSVVPNTDGSFSILLTLQNGTNTITLSAYYSCNLQTSVTSVVVSYVPQSATGTGQDASTAIIRPGNVKPGVISNPNDLYDVPPESNLPGRVKDNLGFGNAQNGGENDQVVIARSWFGLVVTVLATSIALLPTGYLCELFKFLRWKTIPKKRDQYILRFIAALIALIFATIVQA